MHSDTNNNTKRKDQGTETRVSGDHTNQSFCAILVFVQNIQHFDPFSFNIFSILHNLVYLITKEIRSIKYSENIQKRRVEILKTKIKILRILAMYEAENSKICNFCTFWPLILLINHLFKIGQKGYLPNAPCMLKVR